MRLSRRKRTLGERLTENAEDFRERIAGSVSILGADVADQAAELRERLTDRAGDLGDQLRKRSRLAGHEVRDRSRQAWKQVAARTNGLRDELRGSSKTLRAQLQRSEVALQQALPAELRGRSQKVRKQLARQRSRIRAALPIAQPKKRQPARLVGGVVGGVLGAAVGALAVASQFGRDVVPIDRSIEAEPNVFQWRGWRVVYYVQGDESAEPLVLVHSINAAASAYELRAPFARLSDRYKVYAPDLLGFGASERPALEYTAHLYADLLIDFLTEISASAHVVASSLSAAIAVLAADRRPDLFKSLLLINPTGAVSKAQQPGLASRVVDTLYRLPVIGDGMFNILVSRPLLRYYLGQIYSEPAYVEKALVEQNYVTAHQPGARYAPAAFVSGALNVNVAEELRRLQPRTMVVWSGKSRIQRVGKEREAFRQANPGLAVVTYEESGALPHDERREDFEALLRDWLAGREIGGQQVAREE